MEATGVGLAKLKLQLGGEKNIFASTSYALNLTARRSQGWASAWSALILLSELTTRSLEMKSFASAGKCWNNTSGMSYSPRMIFALTCSSLDHVLKANGYSGMYSDGGPLRKRTVQSLYELNS